MKIRTYVAMGAGVAALLCSTSAASAATPILYGSTGADVSWPQCGTGSAVGPMPTGVSYAIVGVNDGRPGTANPCYAAEMGWAATVDNVTSAPVQVYLNTADPGNSVADWPTSSDPTTDPYGSCTTTLRRHKTVGANTKACAYQYGVQEAQYAQTLIGASTPAPQAVWLDVETGNTWQTRSLQGLNQAVVLGMVDTLTGAYTVGVYSTHYQWNKIMGTLDGTSGSTLSNLGEWIPTGTSSATTGDCASLPKIANGPVEFVQYTTAYDYDIACQLSGSI